MILRFPLFGYSLNVKYVIGFLFCAVLAFVAFSTRPALAEAAAQCSQKENIFERLLCFADAAEAAENPDLCRAAADDGVKWQCLAIYAERKDLPALCHEIPAEDEEGQGLRDVCLSDIAAKRGAADLCAEIVTPGLRDSCYVKAMPENPASAYCGKIEDPGLKSLCTGEPVTIP